MELRHLRYFVAVAEELHFHRAAKRLHIEQSPLSRAIKDLEGQLGVRLLERTTRSTTTTKAGDLFLLEARRILASVEHAKSIIRSVSLGYTRQLRIGLSDGVPMFRLGQLLSLQKERLPDLDILLTEIHPEDAENALLKQEVDIAITLHLEESNLICSSAMWHDNAYALIPSGHRLTHCRSLSMDDLIRFPLLIPEANGVNSVHDMMQRACRRLNQTPMIVQRTDNVSLMLAMVRAGMGIGFASAPQLECLMQRDVMVMPLESPRPTITTFMHHHAEILSTDALPFMKLMEEAPVQHA